VREEVWFTLFLSGLASVHQNKSPGSVGSGSCCDRT